MPIVYANIGSNLGDKEALIQRALHEIGEIFGYYCISGFVESEPWGFESTNRFLNIGVAFRTELTPEEVLYKLHSVEQKISKKSHRDILGNYIDREIDIDIMAIDSLIYESECLTIPHEHIKERTFFLYPLKDLCDNWRHPKSFESIEELLDKMK